MSIMSTIFSAMVGTLIFATTSEALSSTMTAVPVRSQIQDEYKWNLDDIYQTDELWQQEYDAVRSRLSSLNQYKNRLDDSAAVLLACLTERDEIRQSGERLYAYARMHQDENTQSSHYQALTGKAESLLSLISEAAAFIEPEVLKLPPETIASYLEQQPELTKYQFWLTDLNRQQAHILSPREEEILSRAGEIGQASDNTYNMLAHADLRFPQITNERGESLQLSESRYRLFIMSPDRHLRQQAFKGLFSTYASYRNTFASTLAGNVKKNIFFAQSRNYNSALNAALEPDQITPAVYDNVIQTVEQNLDHLHRYVALKKRALNLTEIHMYDLYTPIVPDIQLEYSYQTGCDLVRQALAPLGSEYQTALESALTKSWIDVYENQGKQTGAYSWGVFGVHPYILLNYNGRYDDVSTLAHELGHAMHSFFSQQHQPYTTSAYTIFAAEVASTTNEALLMDYMLKTATDKQLRIYLINQYLEQVRATVYRQTMFAAFEQRIHQLAEQGEILTADLLEQIWYDLNVKYYGSEIVVDPEIAIEWARIPHFYSSFYVYQYATGFSAANALAEQILTKDPLAQQRYLNFLKSGGADYSLNLLQQAGVDMSSPEPIIKTLTKFRQLLDELTILLADN